MFILLAVWGNGKIIKEKQVNTRLKDGEKSRLILTNVSRLWIPYHRMLFAFLFNGKSEPLISFHGNLVFKECKLHLYRQHNLYWVYEENDSLNKYWNIFVMFLCEKFRFFLFLTLKVRKKWQVSQYLNCSVMFDVMVFILIFSF